MKLNNHERAAKLEEENFPDLAREWKEMEVLPLCSEIVAAEEKSKETIATRLGFLLLLIFGVYMTVRHWRRKQNP